MALIAKAQHALGDEKAAKENLRQALKVDPNAAEARELQHKILIVDNLNRIASEVEANPGNTVAKSELQRSLAEAAQWQIASPAALTQVARAQSALGQHEKALETANEAVAISPNSGAALRLRDSIKARIRSASPP
jgi:tetratricopeptide (TPR) repeat protein